MSHWKHEDTFPALLVPLAKNGTKLFLKLTEEGKEDATLKISQSNVKKIMIVLDLNAR